MPRRKSKLTKRFLLVGSAVGLVVIIAMLELTNTTHIFHKASVPPVIPAHTNLGTSINSSQGNNTASNNSSSSNNPSPGPTAEETNHTLIAPSGNFVSNHFPGENGSPTTESSVCNTSPGATCYIRFTNTGTGKTTQLADQVADTRGSTSWNWDVSKDAHLTSGQWQITAVATLGSQSKTANDALKLTIK